MNKKNLKSNVAESLRQRAEEQYAKKQPVEEERFAEVDVLKLIHELEVRQIELELQNAELQQAKKEAETAVAKYAAFYNASPSGFITLDRDGMISEINVSGARLFGKVPSYFVHKNIRLFISQNSLHELDDFLRRIFATKQKETGEFCLAEQGSTCKTLHIEGAAFADEPKCLLTLLDITNRKQEETRAREIGENAKKSSELLRGIMESPKGVIVFALDRNYCYTAFTISHKEQMKTVAGCDIEIGMNMLDILGRTGYGETAKANFDRALNGEYFIVEEVVGGTGPGNTFWVNRYSPMYNNSAEAVGLTVFVTEITDQKRVLEELRQSEEKFKAIANYAASWEGWFSSEGKLLWMNPYSEALTGFSPEEYIAAEDYLSMVIAPEDIDFATKQFMGAIHGSRGDNVEIRSMRKDGSKFWVSVSWQPILDANGQSLGFRTSTKDITKRKLVEEELKESEMRFRNLFENAPVGIFNSLPEGRFLSVNPMMATMLGYSSVEEVLATVTDLGTQVYADPEKRGQLLVKVLTQDGWMHEEALWQRKDGDLITVDMTIRKVVGLDGEIAYLQGFIQDITLRRHAEDALKQSEEIFSQFMEHSPIYVFFKDENIRAIRLSRNFESMVNMPLKEMLGKTMDELFPSDMAKKMVADDLRILKEGKKIEIEEELNGHLYSTIKFPIKIAGKPTFLAGFTIDITERKLAEKALKESEASLRELNAAKDKFFSIIAHDLRSPFNTIIGFSTMLTEQIEERNYEGIGAYAKNILLSSQRTLALLMNLLEWSRLQTGRMEFSPEYADIIVLINQVIDLLQDSAKQKAITISKILPRSAPVLADKAMISTVLRNLISNAVKFNAPGGKIAITVIHKQNELEITVRDNGVGIEKDDIGKLFRIDQSFSTKGTQNEKGTGLGLILSKEFVEKHGGRIWVESEPEKGSEFHFTLPRS